MSDRPSPKVAIPEVSWSKLKAEREAKVGAFMEEQGLDALVALASAARGQRGTVRYLSNYATSSQFSCVLWARGGLPRLVVSHPAHRIWARASSWIEDIRFEADYSAGIVRYLQELGLAKGRIGWVGIPLVIQAVRTGLATHALPLEHLSVQKGFDELRATKTEEEVKLVRRCGAIADAVLHRIAERIRPGVTDRDLVAEGEYVARGMGSEGGLVMVTRDFAAPGPSLTDAPLDRGDVLQVSVEPEGPGGFWVQTVRMYALGEPAKELAQRVEKGLEAARQAASLLREGRKISDVANTMLETMGQDEASLDSPVGHGIGLDNSEPPRVGGATSGTLRAGMVIALHPTEYTERSAVFLGDTFLVEKDGSERLSELPLELAVISK